MLIRDGISANDRVEAKDATLRQSRHDAVMSGLAGIGGYDRKARQDAQLRDQINGWFADVANEFIKVPKVVEYENVTWKRDSDGSHTATHKTIAQPDFVLGAASFNGGSPYYGTPYCKGWQLTRVHTATFVVLARAGLADPEIRKHVFFACYSDASALAGPTISKTGNATGGLPLRV